MLSFVYILNSIGHDYFPEQAWLSVISLKKHNKGAHVVLVVDPETESWLKANKSSLLQEISELRTVEIPEGLDGTQKNRYLKTKLREVIEGDFLYLDNDTIVTGSLDGLRELPFDVGAVSDGHKNATDNAQLKDYLKSTSKHYYYDKYFNGGVLFVRNTDKAKELFLSWHKKWMEEKDLYGFSKDQPSLNFSNVEHSNIIGELDGSYNCQVMLPAASEYIMNPLIVHYFTNNKNQFIFPLKNSEVLKDIREHGITTGIMEVIENPVKALLRNCVMISRRDHELFASPMGILAAKLSRDFPLTNSVARFIYRIFGYKI